MAFPEGWLSVAEQQRVIEDDDSVSLAARRAVISRLYQSPLSTNDPTSNRQTAGQSDASSQEEAPNYTAGMTESERLEGEGIGEIYPPNKAGGFLVSGFARSFGSIEPAVFAMEDGSLLVRLFEDSLQVVQNIDEESQQRFYFQSLGSIFLSDIYQNSDQSFVAQIAAEGIGKVCNGKDGFSKDPGTAFTQDFSSINLSGNWRVDGLYMEIIGELDTRAPIEGIPDAAARDHSHCQVQILIPWSVVRFLFGRNRYLVNSRYKSYGEGKRPLYPNEKFSGFRSAGFVELRTKSGRDFFSDEKISLAVGFGSSPEQGLWISEFDTARPKFTFDTITASMIMMTGDVFSFSSESDRIGSVDYDIGMEARDYGGHPRQDVVSVKLDGKWFAGGLRLELEGKLSPPTFPPDLCLDKFNCPQYVINATIPWSALRFLFYEKRWDLQARYRRLSSGRDVSRAL